MGTQLEAHGVHVKFAAEANLSSPEVVLRIHEAYVAAGCQVLTTNTFSMNEIYLGVHGSSERVLDINRVGAELARSAAGSSIYVIGDIGPTGQMLAPFGTYTEDDFYQTFHQQAQVLVSAGVDGLLIETMYDLQEALCALRACKDAGDLPVLMSMAFKTVENGGRTTMGNSVSACATALADAGADVVGANCGDLSVESMADIVSYFREETSLPILVQPNAGIPRLVEGRPVFDLDAITFARGLLQCQENGAHVLGGCCGTSPEHMQQAVRLLSLPGEKAP
jgi:5-methyltetrahydrofolate--homocysteine methyltransferase